MLCQECQKNQATIHLTKMVNGQKTETHLCEVCAAKHGPFSLSIGLPLPFSIHNLLSGLMQEEDSAAAEVNPEQAPLTCPNCGMTYPQFRRQGRFGCPTCYETFESKLEPLMNRIHGSHHHEGKIPLRGGKGIDQRRRLDELKGKLLQAVAKEAFEEAAVLRDEIKRLSLEQEESKEC
jgi:protein arginine kinase activator